MSTRRKLGQWTGT